MGTISSEADRNGLASISRSKRWIVIWFSPPATSLKRVAPSDLKSDLHRMSARSLNKRCAHGKTENRCPPSG